MLLSSAAMVVRCRLCVPILGAVLAGAVPGVCQSGGFVASQDPRQLSVVSPGWTVTSTQTGSLFGASVASAGDVNGDGFPDVIVGAPTFGVNQPNEGRAFVYLGSASGLAAVAAWSAGSDQSNSGYGASVASAGDVNGDGYSDVIVGAAAYTNGQSSEGRAYVYLGSATGLGTTPAWTAEANQAGARFGSTVASAGDVNGDGYSDIIIGATGYSNGEASEGRAYVYLGSASGLSSSPAWTAESNLSNSNFGVVASAGDVNGDGYSDVIVGSPSYGESGRTNSGRAFVFLGSGSGLAFAWAWSVAGEQNNLYFGGSVASAGDVNGDGFSDVIVGAVGTDSAVIGGPGTDSGYAHVYPGSASGLSTTALWSAQGGAGFGHSVASAGDVNGDGYADVVIGTAGLVSPFVSQIFWRQGGVSLYLGAASGINPNPAWTRGNLDNFDMVGASVAPVGDVNRDGLADFITGAPGTNNGSIFEGTEVGRAAIYYGTNNNPSTSIHLSGNGLAITSGDNTPDQADGTDFGTTSIVSGSVRRIFTITNTGESSLTLVGSSRVRVVATTSTQSAFSVTSQPAALVLPGQNTNFEVRFDPTNTIDQSAVLSIVNNTTATNPFTFRVQGKGSLNCDERHTCFVERQYFDFLRRAPDSAGVSFYVDNICSGSSDVDDTVAQFLFADEFTNTVGFVCRAYFGIFNNNAVTTSGSPLYRIPDYEGLRYWSGRMNETLQSGGSLRTAQLNVVAGFAGSQEWRDRVGNRANPEFVDFLYENLLGRFADSAGKAYWVQRLNDGLDRNGVIRDFLTSSEAVSIYAIRVNAGMAYFGLFDRSAEKAGFDFHVDVQTRFGTQAFLRSIIRSSEYRNRLIRTGCFFPEDLP